MRKSSIFFSSLSSMKLLIICAILFPSNSLAQIGGNALEFDGSDDYVFVGNDTSLQVNQYTLTAWVKPYSYSGEKCMEILEKADEYWMNISTRTDPSTNKNPRGKGEVRVGGYFGPDNTHHSVDSEYIVPLNEWTHVACIYDLDSLTLYINGQYEAAVAIPEGYSSQQDINNDLGLGCKTYGPGERIEAQFHGLLDEISIWDSALSVIEIQDVMISGIDETHPYWNHVVAYYKFDEDRVGQNDGLTYDEIGLNNGTNDGAYWVPSSVAFDTADQSSNPYPPNGATDIPIDINMSWTAGQYAMAHHIYLGTDSTLDASAFQGIQSGVTFEPETLQPNTSYYWRVDETNFIDTTIGSVWRFTTESSPLAIPDSLSAKAVSFSQIDLSWSDNSENETGFGIERSLDGVANWMEIASVAENDTAYSDSLLNPSTLYYYRVRAAKLYGYSDYSTIAHAKTMEEPLPPEAPDNLVASVIASDQINLSWLDQSLNEDVFYIERSDDGITGWTLVDSVGENVVKYSDIGLEVHTTYHYRVQAANQNGVSAYSNTDSATTLIQGGIITYLSDLPFNTIVNSWGPVELDRSNGKAEAGDGNIITINRVTYDKGIGCHAYSELVWSLEGKALSFISDIGLDDEKMGAGSVVFEVYLDDVLAFQSDVLTWLDDAVTVGLDVSGVDSLKLIVTDGGDGGISDNADWADARVISNDVISSVSAESDLIQPMEFSLHQNYPNPFNPTTQISYSLAEKAHVQLEVYDIRGRKIKTLVNQEQSSNSRYTVQWNGKDEFGQTAASGIYFYRILATGNKKVWTETRRMILLK